MPGEGASGDIRIESVSKAYGDNQVLDGLCISLRLGGRYCLMAPSGSGKTTLFRILLGLERADRGQITGIEQGEVSAMFQEDRLCDYLTPVDNVLLVDPKGKRARARALLREVLPDSCLDQPASQLSGGMRRRVSLARAMAYPAKLLLLDEPFTGLDSATRREAIAFILAYSDGRTLLVATHGEQDPGLLGADVIGLH